MEKVWFSQTSVSSTNLIINEVLPEASLCTYSIYTPLRGEDEFVLPLPELDFGMVFSISAVSTLKWRFDPVDYAYTLTVKDPLFSGSAKKLALPEKGIRNRQTFSSPPAGRMICSFHCVYRL